MYKVINIIFYSVHNFNCAWWQCICIVFTLLRSAQKTNIFPGNLQLSLKKDIVCKNIWLINFWFYNWWLYFLLYIIFIRLSSHSQSHVSQKQIPSLTFSNKERLSSSTLSNRDRQSSSTLSNSDRQSSSVLSNRDRQFSSALSNRKSSSSLPDRERQAPSRSWKNYSHSSSGIYCILFSVSRYKKKKKKNLAQHWLKGIK